LYVDWIGNCFVSIAPERGEGCSGNTVNYFPALEPYCLQSLHEHENFGRQWGILAAIQNKIRLNNMAQKKRIYAVTMKSSGVK
jgi:hypothetical protein